MRGGMPRRGRKNDLVQSVRTSSVTLAQAARWLQGQGLFVPGRMSLSEVVRICIDIIAAQGTEITQSEANEFLDACDFSIGQVRGYNFNNLQEEEYGRDPVARRIDERLSTGQNNRRDWEQVANDAKRQMQAIGIKGEPLSREQIEERRRSLEEKLGGREFDATRLEEDIDSILDEIGN